MKKTLIALVCGVALLALAASDYSASSSTPYPTGSSAILSVTSATDGQEVTFEGHYFSLWRPDHVDSVIEAGQTPFHVNVDADEFMALFRTLDGAADLRIELNVTTGSGGSAGAASVSEAGGVGVVLRSGDRVAATGL